MIKVGPHQFKALKIWDGWSDMGRCVHCFLPKSEHPIINWVKARPLKDKSEAESNWENWGGN